jgi:hypothetical protein
MIALTDAQMRTVIEAAAPLPVEDRDAAKIPEDERRCRAVQWSVDTSSTPSTNSLEDDIVVGFEDSRFVEGQAKI